MANLKQYSDEGYKLVSIAPNGKATDTGISTSFIASLEKKTEEGHTIGLDVEIEADLTSMFTKVCDDQYGIQPVDSDKWVNFDIKSLDQSETIANALRA